MRPGGGRPDRAGVRGGRHTGAVRRDVGYFIAAATRPFTATETARIHAVVLGAYRWQYIISGVQHPHFRKLLTSMTTADQMARITSALAPIMQG